MKTWCVASLDRVVVEGHRFTTKRWCELERPEGAKGRPEYRDKEKTKCCGAFVIYPCGYEYMEPTCDGTPARD